jgi:protein-S-isoprenylcysteine O-methyltransferase Ste14
MKRPDLRYLLHSLFTESNRGLLLDLVVFVANLFLMRTLAGLFIDLVRHASADEPLAKVGLFLTAVAMYILPAAGALLKRRHFQQRWKEANRNFETEFDGPYGCIFHPIFFLSLNLVLMCAIVAGLGGFLFGSKTLMENGNIFLPLIFGGMFLTILQTYVVYRYFSPPQRPPRFEFLQHPASERLGDLCIFVNMLLFQVAWNLLTDLPLGPPSGAGELIGRIGFLSFVALLVYFPPRMLYLAEDLHRRSTWLTMLLANSPVIARVVLGR